MDMFLILNIRLRVVRYGTPQLASTVPFRTSTAVHVVLCAYCFLPSRRLLFSLFCDHAIDVREMSYSSVRTSSSVSTLGDRLSAREGETAPLPSRPLPPPRPPAPPASACVRSLGALLRGNRSEGRWDRHSLPPTCRAYGPGCARTPAPNGEGPWERDHRQVFD